MNIFTNLDRLAFALRKHTRENEIYSKRNKYAVGAMTMDSSGKITSIAFNSYTKTHPKMKEYGCMCNKKEAVYLHAEVSAIIKAKGKAKKIIVARYNAKGKFAMAKPCPICQIAIKEAEIDEVYYTNTNGEISLLRI
jgi:deoxycytidylate deaminase